MILSLALLAVAAVLVGAQQDDCIVVFSQPHFAGTSVELCRSVPGLRSICFDNVISSLRSGANVFRVSPFYRNSYYVHTDTIVYPGLDKEVPDMRDHDLDNQISSIHLTWHTLPSSFAGEPSPNCVLMFAERNFSGEVTEVCRNFPNFTAIDFETRSWKMGSAVQAVWVFQEFSYHGYPVIHDRSQTTQVTDQSSEVAGINILLVNPPPARVVVTYPPCAPFPTEAPTMVPTPTPTLVPTRAPRTRRRLFGTTEGGSRRSSSSSSSDDTDSGMISIVVVPFAVIAMVALPVALVRYCIRKYQNGVLRGIDPTNVVEVNNALLRKAELDAAEARRRERRRVREGGGSRGGTGAGGDRGVAELPEFKDTAATAASAPPERGGGRGRRGGRGGGSSSGTGGGDGVEPPEFKENTAAAAAASAPSAPPEEELPDIPPPPYVEP